MDNKIITEKMKELSALINFEFEDIQWLAKAMNADKIPVVEESENHKEYANEALATVGDAVLKLVILNYLYNEPITKGSLTEKKKKYEENNILYSITNSEETPIINYAFNENYFYLDSPLEKKVFNPKKHTPYIEAIIGAIFYDSGYEKAKNWIEVWLIEKIEKLIKN